MSALALVLLLAQGGPELAPELRARALALAPLPPVPRDPTNAFEEDPRAARLGQALFFDARLSKNGTISCASCHDPAQGWSDGRTTAVGLAPVARHTPTLLDVAQHRWYFWDGRKDSLWSQALAPLEDPGEHGASRLQLAHLVAGDARYRAAYERVFGALPDLSDAERFPPRGRPVPGQPEHPLARAWNGMTWRDRDAVDGVFANLGKALAAFQRTLVTGPAPFDVFVDGLRTGDAEKQRALDPAARRGLALFLGQARCHTCHDGPFFSDLEFHDDRVPPLEPGAEPDRGRYLGLALVLDDPFNGLGRHSDDPEAGRTRLAYLARTNHSERELKTPTLRNVARTAPYMHQGQLATLADVVRFYSTLEGALPPHPEERLVEPLGLDAGEQADLVAFLESLTGTPVPPERIGIPEEFQGPP
ncbi:MAG TPA: cytochrome c peroxidase [Planctomycetota bacterium]